MSKILERYISKNKGRLNDLIKDNKEGSIIDLIIQKENKRYFLEIRNKDYKLNKINMIMYSKVYDIIKGDKKIGIIRESYDESLYNWLRRNPSRDDIKIVKDQIKILNSILGKKKISKLEDIWIRKVNKSFPVIIKGTRIVHNGNLIGLINIGNNKLSINKINMRIRLMNLKELYNKNELEKMYSNILNDGDIFEELVKNNIDNELIMRRIECSNIASLI